ncbi:hypothetical protein [Streptomyces botrytidirepellens]|uniref:hypothetical protein n=1 Tax=Streptomyces botrytidirepellens TaxID=2486417 RepID=UPI003CCC8EA6
MPGSEPDLDDLHHLCSEQLTAYKRPAAIMVIDSIPHTPANKVDRKALHALWADAVSRPSDIPS